MFPIQCTTLWSPGAVPARNGSFFREKPQFTMENFGTLAQKLHFGPKCQTPLRQNLSNKLFGVCTISGVLMLYEAMKNTL